MHSVYLFSHTTRFDSLSSMCAILRAKGPRPNSGQGHLPWLQALPGPGSGQGSCRGQPIYGSLTSVFPSVFPSLKTNGDMTECDYHKRERFIVSISKYFSPCKNYFPYNTWKMSVLLAFSQVMSSVFYSEWTTITKKFYYDQEK